MKIISKKDLFPTKTLEFKTDDGKYILAEKSTFQRIFGRKDTLYRYIWACRLLEGKKEEVMAAFDGKIPSGISFIKKDIEMANENTELESQRRILQNWQNPLRFMRK